VIISTVMIGLSGFLMGMPFPLALEKAKGHSVDIIPWCWAINGFASVLSSFLSTILAIHIGFTAILAIGGTLYLLAGLILTLTPDKRNEQDVS
ncbi:MAG TPA: SAM-dependent methyltransferase, partial [bacterium]|nr:SAM-dependent methyltransferase [bacterium]